MRKKSFTLIILFLSVYNFVSAQIICIQCFDQNDSISFGVTNLLVNGGFENNTCIPNGNFNCFCPNSSDYACDVSNWICTGGGTATYAGIIDTDGIVSMVVEGGQAAYFGSFYCNACSSTPDDTTCILNSSCVVNGIPPGFPESTPLYGGTTGVSLKQSVSGLQSGNIYVLEFWAGGEYNSSFPDNGLFAVDVGFGDTFLRDKPTPVGSTGTRYVIIFSADSSTHTIKFTNWGHICSYCTELVIDDVRLYTLAQLSQSIPHCTDGINELSFNFSVNVYPNPITNELRVEANSNGDFKIVVYNILSQSVLQKEFEKSATLNTEQLPEGIYIYEVRNKNEVIQKGKVVKE
jgi:hypothetical protein